MAVIKAVLTRLVFAAHGGLAIWQVVQAKADPLYWYLTCPILLLGFEGIFTLVVKETHEWKWFCPSVFLYLSSVVPAIWLLELDKVERRFGGTTGLSSTISSRNDTKLNELSGPALAEALAPWLGPDVVGAVTTSTWVTVIEQLLMLVLIIGRWMLPKGELTRDQLSQLLLVYIGTAADIIELFDSFKDDTIAREPILVVLTLAIWSWSLLQFTVVLTATKSRKSRAHGSVAVAIPSAENPGGNTGTKWCTIDFWAIALNIGLQDLPFLAFRLLLILHFRIITYMNIFFTCKNTLVIVLQLYRLYVVQTEAKAAANSSQVASVSSNPSGSAVLVIPKPTPRIKTPSRQNVTVTSISGSLENREASLNERTTEIRGVDDVTRGDTSGSASETEGETVLVHLRRCQRTGKLRQDTGYSTASSSQDAVSIRNGEGKRKCRHCRRSRRP